VAPPGDGDETVRLPPRRAPSAGAGGRRRWLLAGLALLLALALGGAWFWLRPAPARFAVRTATEEQILANNAPTLAVFRFADNPRILVLDFPDLLAQGMMLNRVAALVEKAGLPRDRLLNDAELDAAIRARGDTPATFYYGHDYPTTALVRFFRLAGEEGVKLDAQEKLLHALLAQEGYLRADAPAGAVISIPHAGLDPVVDASTRATILRHELSHGEFFTVPAYASYVLAFWRNLAPADQALFRRFLADEGYDVTQPELVANEMQAYLMFTPDPRFFNAGVLGTDAAHLQALRAAFLGGMPKGWLRDLAAGMLAPVAAQRAPRRRYLRGAVSRRSAVPARLSPRLRRVAMAASRSRR
jgi:hypothetical protein